MLSKEAVRRYFRVLQTPQGEGLAGWGPSKKERPSVELPDPRIDDGAPMEQARPMSLDWHSRETSKASLEAKLCVVREAKQILKILPGTNQEIALAAFEVYLDIFHVYGFDFARFPISLMTKQVTKSLVMMDGFLKNEGEWMKYFKWKNAAFFSAWMGQVQPAPPVIDVELPSDAWKGPKWIFGGAFYSFLQRNMHDQEFRRSFCLSILQSKKGMPRPTDRMVKAAEKKAAITMTTPKEQTEFRFEWKHFDYKQPLYSNVPDYFAKFTENRDPYGTSVVFNRRTMEEQCRRTTREIFRNFTLPLEALSYYVFPSSSANYNMTRTKRGTWGTLDEQGYGLRRGMVEDIKAHGSQLRFTTKMTKLSEEVSQYYGEVGRKEQAVLDLEEGLKEVIGLEINDDEFLPVWRRFYWRCVAAAMTEKPLAAFVGLKEALKIRCISKGPPLTYFVLKPFQKAMWRQLQKFSTFELTGTPITEELMNRRFSRLGPAWRYHSGDYSAATDELHSWVSETIGDEFFDILDTNMGYDHSAFRELFTRALTKHLILDKKDHYGMPSQEVPTHLQGVPVTEELPQRRGQLMGSIISFVILCIANASLVRFSWEVAHNRRNVPLLRIPLWINGDDCLTAYQDPSFPEVWHGLGDIMGLSESVGKTYDSPVFCSINSHFFMQDERGFWDMIPYVNMGLMAGLDRSSGGEKASQGKTPMELGTINHELIGKCPEFAREAVQNLFMYRHGNTLKEFKGEWFFPHHLFGAGLVSLSPYTRDNLSKAAVTKILLSNGLLKNLKDTTGKDWALYDHFGKVVRKECPLVATYSYKRYENDEGYSAAFYSVILYTWATEGLDSLLAKQLKSVAKWPAQLARAVKLINSTYASYVERFGYVGLKCKPEEMVDETKMDVEPIWGTSGI